MKKVLIVTYYWPPSGGGGVQRWLKFSKYLPDFGWEPVIFTPENPDFEVKDESLLTDVRSDMEIIRFPIWEPYHIFRKLTGAGNLKQGQVLEKSKRSLISEISIWIRGNFFIPDPRIFWVKPSAKYLTDIQEFNHFEAVITTGPPHSMHLIGHKLKKKTGIKWIADFRDPWSEWDILQKLRVSGPAMALHRKLERKVLKNADMVITVSESWSRGLKQLGASKVETITNGYDPDDFRQSKISKFPSEFRISHVGMINELRSSMGLKKALNDLCLEDTAFFSDLVLNFTGIISETFINRLGKDSVFAEKIKVGGYMPHEKVKDELSCSAVLLLLLNQSENARGHLPGKLFEYLASGNPILALGPIGSDAAKIIESTNSGYVCDPDDVEAIKNALLKLFWLYKEGKTCQQKNIEVFSRKALTEKLVRVLNSLFQEDQDKLSQN